MSQGTKHIEGIIPHNLYYQDSLEGVTFTAETFRKMVNLRFLYLEKGYISESFKQTFDALRWLCWESFPLPYLPSELRLQKLIILELPHSDLRIMWQVRALDMFLAFMARYINIMSDLFFSQLHSFYRFRRILKS